MLTFAGPPRPPPPSPVPAGRPAHQVRRLTFTADAFLMRRARPLWTRR